MPISETKTDALDWLWLVMDPTPVSELADILYHPGNRLRDWCVGCAVCGDIPAATLYADDGAARTDALARIAKRDREAQAGRRTVEEIARELEIRLWGCDHEARVALLDDALRAERETP